MQLSRNVTPQLELVKKLFIRGNISYVPIAKLTINFFNTFDSVSTICWNIVNKVHKVVLCWLTVSTRQMKSRDVDSTFTLRHFVREASVSFILCESFLSISTLLNFHMQTDEAKA